MLLFLKRNVWLSVLKFTAFSLKGKNLDFVLFIELFFTDNQSVTEAGNEKFHILLTLLIIMKF